jgi:molecular chaperone DnaK
VTDPIVGIDLGTSNTVVAHTGPQGVVAVLADANGFKIHPSVVSFHPTGGVVVGAAAKQRKVIDPKNTIYSVKRLIGRAFSSKEVQTARQRAPFQIKEGANQLPLIVTRAGEFAVPEISAIVLDHAKNVAASALQTPVGRAVVTVPASFNDAQRSATATAGSIAGLTVVRVLNEPTAAALAYGHARTLNQTIAVFDFGGGTFDITILKLADQVYEVLGTSGDTFLGGDDIDERLVDRMVEKFLMENRIDLRTNEVSMMRLRAVAEQVKIELSRRTRAVVRIDEVAYGPKGKPLDLQIEIRREELIRQCADIIDRAFPVCEESLKYANLSVDQIDDVILVGGTTKIPYVRDQVAKFFGKAPRTDVNPEDAVAVGAALQAQALERMLGGKRPSRQIPAFGSEESTFNGETGSRETITAAESPQVPETPLPQVEELLELTEPTQESPGRGKRHSDAFRAVMPQEDRTEAPEPNFPGNRAVLRGEHHDRFDDRRPPPVPSSQPVIGRMTRPNVTPPAGAKSPKPITQPVAVVPPPIPQAKKPPPIPPGPASTLRGIAPVHEEEDTNSGIATDLDLSISTKVVADELDFPDPPTRNEPGLAQLAKQDAAKQSPATTARGFAAAPQITQPQTTQPLPMSVPRAPAAQPPQRPAKPSPAPPPFSPAPAVPPPFSPPPLSPPPATTASTLVVPPQPTSAPTLVVPPPPQTFPVMPPPRAPVVMDVTPRGLGIGTVAGFCEELIRRNSRVPAEIRKLFTTSRDGQDSVRIIVCQGESRRLVDNVVIGDLLLSSLPARPRGETSIEVTFALDASGILQVRARDAQTGREQRATLDIVGSLQQEDVDAAREKLASLRR